MKDNSVVEGDSPDGNTVRAFELNDLDIEFVPESINLVTGPTGSGKSSRELTENKGNLWR